MSLAVSTFLGLTRPVNLGNLTFLGLPFLTYKVGMITSTIQVAGVYAMQSAQSWLTETL